MRYDGYFFEERNAKVGKDRKALNNKIFDQEDDPVGDTRAKGDAGHNRPESDRQSWEDKPEGFHYCKHRGEVLKQNIIVKVDIEPANQSDLITFYRQMRSGWKRRMVSQLVFRSEGLSGDRIASPSVLGHGFLTMARLHVIFIV